MKGTNHVAAQSVREAAAAPSLPCTILLDLSEHAYLSYLPIPMLEREERLYMQPSYMRHGLVATPTTTIVLIECFVTLHGCRKRCYMLGYNDSLVPLHWCP
jgi:hypothetical protein